MVFVDRALPGERLLARVLQSKRSYARASKLRSLAPHDDAAEPVCEVSKHREQVSLASLQHRSSLGTTLVYLRCSCMPDVAPA